MKLPRTIFTNEVIWKYLLPARPILQIKTKNIDLRSEVFKDVIMLWKLTTKNDNFSGLQCYYLCKHWQLEAFLINESNPWMSENDFCKNFNS